MGKSRQTVDFSCFKIPGGSYEFFYSAYPVLTREHLQMADTRITKRSVEGLTCPPGRDRVFLWDGSLSGFGVTVMASGKRIYVAQFRQHGRSRRMKLGEHGRMTPDQARSLAKEVLGVVEGG